MSVLLSTGFPLACSGDIYQGVPMRIPIRVRTALVLLSSGEAVGVYGFAMPKSMIFTRPSSRSFTFSGLISRWMTFLPCAYWSPRQICRA